MGVSPAFNHPWDLPPAEAKRLQRQLRDRVRIEPITNPVRWIAGVDVSVRGEVSKAAVVVLSFPELEPTEAVTAERPVEFPYIPGLLAFREGPVVLDAMAKLRQRPDLVIFDAHGLSHPRRMGLATHLGVLLDLPSIGCAKSRLCGEHGEPPPERGGWTPLFDGEEVIGAVLRTRTGVHPVYVSIGHRIDLEGAVEWVLRCCTRYRLPEPTRWAHRVAGGESIPTAHQPTLF
ncbi:MAG TPA: deoxyribonuclease V [Thermoflexia bacterium]|jgi:deoxyribonuclease V|nr:deoxyribonuclease V [Thermoflexia bacterium]